MKKVIALTLSSCALLFGCSDLKVTTEQTEQSAETNTAMLYGEGSIEDKESRQYYDWMRFKHPQTDIVPTNIRQDELNFYRNVFGQEDVDRSSNWRSIGPYNVGGRTRAIAIDVTDENIMLAGAVSGGMWRTTDGGQSWANTTDPAQLHSVTCIAQDRRAGNTNTWYYGSGENRGNSADLSGNGVFKSTDGGQSWSLLASTTSSTPHTMLSNGDMDFVWEIETDHTDLANDVVLAAVYNGVYRSADGGQSWDPVLGLDTSVTSASRYTDLMITPSGVFYAAMSTEGPTEGIFRSTDGGQSWTDITPAAFPNNLRRIEMAYSPSDEDQIYLVAETPGSGATGHNLWHYEYVSGDGSGSGGNWDNRTSNLPNGDCTGFYTFNFGPYNTQSSYDMCIAVKPDNANVVFIGGTNIYRSVDGFTSGDYEWIGGYQCDSINPSNYIWPNHHPDQHEMLFLPSDPDVMISAHDGGVSRTNNCLQTPPQWINLNNGYSTGQFYTVAIEPGQAHNDFVVGGLQDNGTWFTNSYLADNPWKMVFYGDGAYCAITNDRRYYYLSWQTGKTFKFDIDDSGNVLGLTRIDPAGGSGYQFINPFILDPNDDKIMYLAAGRYIWRNNNLDEIPIIGDEYNTIDTNWVRINGSVTGSTAAAPRITTLDMSLANSDVLYYATWDSDVFRVDSAKSDNAVKVILDNSEFPTGSWVSCVEVDNTNEDNVLLSFSNYGVKSIFYTEDGGSNWQDVSGNLEEFADGSGSGPSVVWVHIYKDATNTMYYAGTTVGLFSTEVLDGTNTVWQPEGAGSIGNVPIHMITSRTVDGYIVAATHGKGMYATRLYEPFGIDESAETNGASMDMPYPNPFSTSTKIKFFLPESAQVEMNAYDVNGRKVSNIVSGKYEEGAHSVKWTGTSNHPRRLSDGVYYVSFMVDGNLVNTHKLILLSR